MFEFSITTTATDAEQLAETLSVLGAEAITWQDAGDQAIYEPLPGEFLLWQAVRLSAFVSDHSLLSQINQYLIQQQQQETIKQFTVNTVVDQDWVRASLDQFMPMSFGNRLWVSPSWHVPVQLSAVNVILDPGLAFGTGSHPTTALCLAWLDEHIQGNETILDFGCGSGVLAVAALKLGAAQAFAVDHDPQALVACSMNMERNDIACERYQTRLSMPLLTQQVDVLIANVLAKPLIELAETLMQAVKPHGKLVLSGILCEQAVAVCNAYAPWFQFSLPVMQDGWVRLEGIRLAS